MCLCRWIEPEDGRVGYSGFPVQRVRHFWEKPSIETAQRLVELDCLWSTFVKVGQVQAFLRIIEAASPRWYAALVSGVMSDPERETRAMTLAYAALEPADFSKEAISANAENFALLRLGEVGWSDLGDPARVRALMAALERKTPARESSLAARFAFAGSNSAA
jgi:mannose-1-phosphate guanylyltransferase